MLRLPYSVDLLRTLAAMEQPPDVRHLLHHLNNQLGIVLAHAELMESKAADDPGRARAAQIVTALLEAMGTAKQIGLQIAPALSEREP